MKKFTKSIEKSGTHLCVGLDFDYGKASQMWPHDFTRRVIEATKDLVCAYKINPAFFDSYGPVGVGANSLWHTVQNIPDDIPIIFDGKFGDILHTNKHHAKVAFDQYGADAVTVNPFVGWDALEPFLEREDKTVFALAYTSNEGSGHYQTPDLYKRIVHDAAYYNSISKATVGIVAGATHPDRLKFAVNYDPNTLVLIPGVGAQGGAVQPFQNSIVTASRSILYPSEVGSSTWQEDVREAAIEASERYQTI